MKLFDKDLLETEKKSVRILLDLSRNGLCIGLQVHLPHGHVCVCVCVCVCVVALGDIDESDSEGIWHYLVYKTCPPSRPAWNTNKLLSILNLNLKSLASIHDKWN